MGYSPERINPGDRVHTLKTVVKIVSGSGCCHPLDLLAGIYGSIVQAGVHRAPAIRVAEAAAGVIEKHPAGPEYRPDERTGHHLREKWA